MSLNDAKLTFDPTNKIEAFTLMLMYELHGYTM